MAGTSRRRLTLTCQGAEHTIVARKNRKLALCNHDEGSLMRGRVLKALGGAVCPCVEILSFAERTDYIRHTSYLKYKNVLKWLRSKTEGDDKSPLVMQRFIETITVLNSKNIPYGRHKPWIEEGF